MALGGALGPACSRVTPRHFAWQAWHLVTSTLGSRGRRGTISHPRSFCVAGVALMALGGALGPAWSRVTPRHFAWQAWHLVASTLVSPGRRGTISHPRSFCVAGVALMALGGALGPAWSRVTPQHFAWQAWHLVTSTLVSSGRRATWTHPPSLCLAGVALMALGWLWRHTPSLSHTIFHTPLSHTIFHTPSFIHPPSRLFHTPSSSHNIFHTPSFTPNFVTPIFDTPSFTHHIVTHHLCHTIFHTQICHPLSFTHNFVTHYLSISFTHNFVTHHFVTRHLSHTVLDTPSFTPLCHTPSFTPHFCPTPLCHTPFFTHHFVTHHLSPHHLSHTTLSHTFFHHTIFHTQLCRTPSSATPSFTHHFATHHLSHTTLSPTIFDTPSFTHNFVTHNFVTHTICLCHAPSFTYNFVTHNFALRLSPPPPPLSFLIGTSCLVGLSGPSIFLCFQKHWYLQCFAHLWSKKYWYLHHLLRFCIVPAKDVKTQKSYNLKHFVNFEKLKKVRKICQNGF